MKLASYEYRGVRGWGAVDGDGVIPLGHAWSDVKSALADGPQAIAAESARVPGRISLRELTWLPPVPDPGKILCVGINYGKHVAETGRALPTHPSVFIRFADSFVGHLASVIRPSVSTHFDYEAELAVVIGREGRHISAGNAHEHIAGYTCMAENSLRDFQKHNAQVVPGKNFEASGGIGPWIVTADEMPFLERKRVISRLNGQQMQCAFVGDMIFPVDRLIEYISTFTTLRPGDIIATGTPEGVGAVRQPPIWMKAGDVLEVEIDGIGTLRNPVVDEAAS